MSMCYKKQDITLEQHEKDDLLDCDSDYWLGSFPGHPINCLKEEAFRRVG
jgi:hypothetical protein